MNSDNLRAVEAASERYGRRLDSEHERQYWRDNHAGQDMGALWRRIRDLEEENRELRERLADRVRSWDLAPGDPPDSCQCGVPGASPPCSWCTSDDNPLNRED